MKSDPPMESYGVGFMSHCSNNKDVYYKRWIDMFSISGGVGMDGDVIRILEAHPTVSVKSVEPKDAL